MSKYKRIGHALLGAAFLLGGATGAEGQSTLASADIDRISMAVVRVVTLQGESEISTGSGTVIDPSGLVYTNRHVIEDGNDFRIEVLEDPDELPSPRYRARIVGYSPDVDFAVLRIDRDHDGRPLLPSDVYLPAVSLMSPEANRGDRIYVLGYPGLGEGFLALTEGTVTTIRNGTLADRRLPVWYQTDAHISPGNSGGLAVNAAGEIVGIPTSVQTEERTGGRLGGILAIGAIEAALERGLEGGVPSEGSGTTTPVITDGRLDYTEEPYFGSVSLSAGFLPDPHAIELLSGGEVDASYLGGSCVGHAAVQPDYRIHWSGSSPELRVLFTSDDGEDTTLLINLPDGSWACNDDANGTLDPMAVLADPQEGQYDVWVGSYSAGAFIDGTLHITERDLDPTTAAGYKLDPSGDPYFGAVRLRAGFAPDPSVAEILAGGPVDASYLGGSCLGHAGSRPDLGLEWSGTSSELRLLFSAEGGADATLVVHLPDGTWACNDDAGSGTVDPMVILDSPPPGRYSIWVGAYARGDFINGRLSITEFAVNP